VSFLHEITVKTATYRVISAILITYKNPKPKKQTKLAVFAPGIHFADAWLETKNENHHNRKPGGNMQYSILLAFLANMIFAIFAMPYISTAWSGAKQLTNVPKSIVIKRQFQCAVLNFNDPCVALIHWDGTISYREFGSYRAAVSWAYDRSGKVILNHGDAYDISPIQAVSMA
jgi:hypothetical protein